MAEEKDKKEKKETAAAPAAAPAAAQQAQQAQQALNLKVDGAKVTYANMARAMGTPDEVILDLGLNPNPYNPAPSEDIHVDHRIVMNYLTTKRLLVVLNEIIRRHESNFGVIELDINRRIQRR